MFSKRRTWLLGIAALVALARVLISCGKDTPGEVPTATADPALAGLVMKLTRTQCGFSCPWFYDLTIRGDGSVEYEGTGELDVFGPATGAITQAQVRSLSDRFDEIGFADLEETICLVSDSPSTHLTLIREPGVAKTIRFCPIPKAPTLEDLADFIDEITDSKRWVGEIE